MLSTSRISQYSILFFVLFCRLVSAGQDIYVAGFVVDNNGRKLPDVTVIIEHEYKEYGSVKTNIDGWFEIGIPLPGRLIGEKVNVTFLKSGYQFVTRPLNIVQGMNFIDSEKLLPLLEYIAIDPVEEKNFTQVYGYVQDTRSGMPLPGATVTYKIHKSNEINKVMGIIEGEPEYYSVTASKSSGYFTISYPVFYAESNASYVHSIVFEHPDFDRFETKPKPSKDLMTITALKERIDWLIRFNLIAEKDEVGGYAPFKFEVNFRKLFEVLINTKMPDFKSIKWSLPVAIHNTRETDVSTVHFSVTKPISRKNNHANILIDGGLGIGRVEINKTDEHEFVFPHLQIGLSKYLNRPISTNTSPHVRIGLSYYQLDSDDHLFVELGIGF